MHRLIEYINKHEGVSLCRVQRLTEEVTDNAYTG